MKQLTLILSIVLLPLFGKSQQSKWINTPKNHKSFIENKGQFSIKPSEDFNTDVEFSFDGETEDFYFTKSGVVFLYSTQEKRERSLDEKKWREEKKKQGFANQKEFQEFEKAGHKLKMEYDEIRTEWIGANQNVQIIGSEKTTYHHSYWITKQNGKQENVNLIPSYKKITYKNLYPNIDIEYELHPENGIKYTVIVHPGGDITNVKLRYSKQPKLQANGNIITKTIFGDVTDHAPLTFYANNKTQTISSAYEVNNNIITFKIGNYDNTKTIIIDPWTQSPNFATDWKAVWECEVDAAGNAYIIGGVMPLQLHKYNAAGVLQWVYNTPYDTTSWLGTFATDDLGNSYVTNGSTAAIQKISTAGGVLWNNGSPGGLFASTEFWNIAFNCDQTKLVVAGTGGTLPPLPFIYDINMNTGNVLTSVQVTGGALIPTQEVRAITATSNEKYYWLSHDSIGFIDQGLANCPGNPSPFHVDNTYNLGYKNENWRKNNSGIEAIAYYGGFIFVNRGNRLDKRDFYSGNVLSTVAIPGGAFTNVFLGGNTVENSGISIDDCGNIFVGSKNGVYKFNQALVQIANYPTSFNVYDVEVSTAGDIIAAGSTGNSGSSIRTGSVQSFAAAACARQAATCCNPSICQVPQMCDTDAPITLTPFTSGGTWTPYTGLNTTTGVFDPSVAGPGTHTIYYSLACGTDSVTIVVNICANLSVCIEANGDLTVSNGTPVYTWEQWTPPTSTPISNQTQCQNCGYTWFFGSCLDGVFPVTTCNTPGSWTTIGTGSTITPPPGIDTLRVTDSFGNVITINGISNLLPCLPTSCDATITPAGPFCENASALTLSAADPGGVWSGTGITNTSTGVFDPSTAGAGTHQIIYTISGSCNDADTISIVVNAADDASFSYSPTTYCVTDPNPTPTITGTAGGTFTIDNSGVINASTGEVNITSSGTGAFNVTYTTNGTCPDTATVTINITTGANATITAAGPFCENASAVTLSAVDPGGVWSGTGITNTSTGVFNPSTAGAGTHQIIYTISGSCGDADTISIIVNAQDDATFSFSPTTFCSTDPNPTPTITGTTGGTFTIDNSGVINASTGEVNISGSGIGFFNVTYITSGTCPDTLTFSININNCTLPQPVANFSASQTNICEGDCINFTDLSTSSATGGITAWSWTFTGGTPATSSQQNPTNICYLSAGTYTVSLTVTDANGSDDSTIISYITVTNCTTPTAGFSISDDEICIGNCINFTDMSTGATSWEWTFNGGNPSTSISQNPTNICFANDGIFTIELIASNTFGSDTITQTITVHPNPIINAGSDVVIDLGDNTNLNATGSNGNYNWIPPTWLSCPTCPSTSSTPDETITYTVIVVDSNGCSASDQVTVFVEFENVIWVPNIFSPNGDGNNDILFVRGKGVAQLNFFVYDRWGEKVFETTNIDQGWNGKFRGKEMNKAVFVYYLEATFIDGSKITKKGDVTLIR